MRQTMKPTGARGAEPIPPIMMAGWLGERLRRGVGRVWYKMRSPGVRAQGRRLPSAEQMEALRAKFAKDEPRKEQRAKNGRANTRT